MGLHYVGGALFCGLLVGACGSSAEGAPASGAAGGSSGASSLPGGEAAPALAAMQPGIATFYDADGSGACSFDPSPRDLDVAAMNQEQYAAAAVCGSCVAVAGPAGKVTVRVVDRCPECQSGHLDLSRSAFGKIADPVQGRVAISWTTVPCAVSGPVAYHVKEGSNPYWLALQVRNARLPVASLAWKAPSGWQPVKREEYNYFVMENAGAGPVSVRITSSDGQILEDTLATIQEKTTVSGVAQFR